MTFLPEGNMGYKQRRSLAALVLAPTLLLLWAQVLQVGAGDAQLPAPALPPSVIGQAIAAVSGEQLEVHLCHLQDKDGLGYCNTLGSRHSRNAAGLREAGEYIAGQFSAYGLPADTQPFTLPGGSADQGDSVVITNVIGTLEGVAPPAERGVVILSAHYDSTASGASSGGAAPGADDNGSGVAAVLEAARLLSQYRLWHTVRFVTFAGEEQGLHGSRHYAGVARQTGERIIAVLNADMIAYETDGEPRLEVHAGPDPRNIAIAAALTEAIGSYNLELLPQVVVDAPVRASDHASFWDQGFPAVLVIEDTDLAGPTADFNPYYHTPHDTLDKINRTYFTAMVRALVGAAARLARPVAPDLRVIQQGPADGRPGQSVTFTLAFSNTGIEPAAGAILTDTLSHGLAYESDSSGLPRAFDVAGQVIWELGDLDGGAGGSFVLTATVLSEVEEGASLRSRATIAGSDLDADGADNVSTVDVVVRKRWQVYLPIVATQLRAGLRRRW